MYTVIVLAPNRDCFARYVHYVAGNKKYRIGKTAGKAKIGIVEYVHITSPERMRGIQPKRVVQLRDWQLGFREDDLEDVEIQLQLWKARNSELFFERPPFL